jgi:hypothetical protein
MFPMQEEYNQQRVSSLTVINLILSHADKMQKEEQKLNKASYCDYIILKEFKDC